MRLDVLRVLGLASVLSLAAEPGVFAADTDDPDAELASLKVADGFEVNLFASERDGIAKPIQIRFDPQGRLYVVCSQIYPQIEPGREPDDKIFILEDTNGDGRADKSTIFAGGLFMPTGIELGDHGVYVGNGTQFLHLSDIDGDGRADEKTIVLRGFGTGDAHQNINSFQWGPGGELWFSQGLHIFSQVETPWGIVRLEQAGIWRFWPRRLKLEGFYGSAYEPQNPWGFVFTEWGEPIVLAGNNSSPIYAVPGLTSNHRSAPPPLIWKNGRGRKVSGGDIVGSSHFPEAWQGALILGGYINNAVWTLKINDDGAGFSLEDLPPLIVTTNKSFRPVDVKFGPDGALYICDWYNPIIGHYQASFRHPDRDKAHGRIWRVTARGRPLAKPARLADAPTAELLNRLTSSDRWTRRFAKRVLADRPTGEVTGALKEWLKQPGLSEHALVEALGVYQSHEIPAPELLARLCRASDPGARAYAAGVVGVWADRLADPLALLRLLLADENPRVRLQAVVACTYVPKAEAMEVAAVAADFPTDRFLGYALDQAVFALKPRWIEAFKSGTLKLANKPSRIDLLVRADGTPDTVRALRELLNSTGLDSAGRETYLQILADTGDADDLARMLKLNDPGLQARLLPVVADASRVRNLRPNGDPAEELRPLVESTNIELRAEAFKLVALWKVEAFHAAARTAALDAGTDLRVRRAAIESLGSFGGDVDRSALLQLSGDNAPRIRSASIVALSALSLRDAARITADSLARLNDETALQEILFAFLQRLGGADALADALSTAPPPKPVAEAALRMMSGGGRRDVKLAELMTKAAGQETKSNQMTPDEMNAFVAEVRTSGDARRGTEIFRRPELGCTVCHSVNGQGGRIGPDLSALGTAQPIDFIAGAILEPQKEIKEGYVSISVITRDGEEYQGYELREDGDALVLREVLQNKEVRIRRDTIKEKKQNGSVMPNGLADHLSRSEFRDLVRYLSELGKPQ